MKLRVLKVLFLSLIVFGSLYSAKAQVLSFSTDTGQFIKEFEKFIKIADNKQLNADLKVFKTNWSNGSFTPFQQKTIIKICNDMLAERMTVQPHFELLMKAIASFITKKLPDKVLIQWQGVTQNLLGKKNTDYLKFLELSSQLFEGNILFNDGVKKWYASNSNFDLLFEKNKLIIKFSKLNLLCRGFADQLEIENTSGYLDVGKAIWYGTGGTVKFRYLRNENATVELNKYSAKIESSEYEVDSVLLNFPKYFSAKVAGKFEDKLSNVSDTTKLREFSYPRFIAFQNTLEIKNIVGPLATFKGGFSLKGGEISTATADGALTEIKIYYKGKHKATMVSKNFGIRDGVANSPHASFVLLLDSGNVYHPNVSVNFQFAKNYLEITREDIGLMRVPFTDEYHKLDFDVQQLKWKIDGPFVDLDNFNNDKEARISSANFFKEILYARIQGALNFNPAEALTAYYGMHRKGKKGQKVAVKEIASFLNTRADYMEAAMIQLHDLGFIQYFPKENPGQEDSILYLDKIFIWVQNHQKSRDYDVIRLNSVIAARPNATINLEGNDLNIEGVPKFYFSDSQNVVVVPTDQKLSVLRNRRLKFGGRIRAGRFDFYGKKFELDYNNFQILYSNIDSMKLYFPDSAGRGLVAIKSVLRNIYGTLYIDKPNNKSGLQNYPEYPIFRSEKGSEILYDKPNIHGGAYKAPDFVFLVDPFTIDSLDNFTIQGLQFDGTFKSAGIFPEFKHKASIQKDYSLGFVKKTEGPTTMYQGKGVGEMTMSLSEEGFYGINGKIEYNGSTTEFSKLLLLPDKAVGTVSSYDVAQNAKYPEVHGKNVELEWQPYSDQMIVNRGDEPFSIFKSNYIFDGQITQTPSNIKGNGTLKWPEAHFTSKEMVFGTNKAEAKSASLKIFGADSTKIAFETQDVKGIMDFDKKLGTFTSNVIGSKTRFPYNLYETNLNDYKWDMNKQTIEAKVGPAMAGTAPYFLALPVEQDSLKFEGKKAIYDLKNYTLRIEQIPYIDIADSRLFPNRNFAVIRGKAEMDVLDSAKIIANRKDKFHDIYGVKIKILGKNKFKGTGKYQYVNRLGARQEFELDSIVGNANKNLEAWGIVKETQNFTLDTKIGYWGKAQVLSTEKNIYFDGFVKPLHSFTVEKPTEWVGYKGRIDPKNVILYIPEPRTQEKVRQYIGLYITRDSTSKVYPVIFGQKKTAGDPCVQNDTGVLFYDASKESFFMGSKEKLVDKQLKGSFMQLNDKTKAIHAEGVMDFGINVRDMYDNNDFVKFVTAGSADLKPKDTAFEFNLAMLLDFPLTPEITKRITTLFKESTAIPGNINNPFFKDCLGQMIANDKTARSIISGIEKNNQIPDKEEGNYKFIISDANFRWDRGLFGMYCKDGVTVASVAGTPMNKSINAIFFIESKRRKQMYMYLDLGDDKFIYMNIQTNRVYMFSNDEELTKYIGEASQTSKGIPEGWTIIPTSQRAVDKFLKKIPIMEE